MQSAESERITFISDVDGQLAESIGMYGYLDAALHVKLSMGADVVMKGVSERYKGNVGASPLRPAPALPPSQ